MQYAWVAVTWLTLLLCSCSSAGLKSQEIIRFADEAFDHLELSPGFLPQGAEWRFVSETAGRLSHTPTAGATQWSYFVLDSPGLNATCLPPDRLIIEHGLLEYLDTQLDVAIVVAHEMAHCLLRDFERRERLRALIQLGHVGIVVGGASSPSESAAHQTIFQAGSPLAIFLPYTRRQEFEADRLGARILKEAGYEIDSVVVVYKRLDQILPHTGGLWATHPAWSKRIRRMEKIAIEEQ